MHYCISLNRLLACIMGLRFISQLLTVLTYVYLAIILVYVTQPKCVELLHNEWYVLYNVRNS